MDYDEFKNLSRHDQVMKVVNLIMEARREGLSWEVALEECKGAILFALSALKMLGRGSDAVESVLIKMLLQAYETLARKELGEGS